MLDYVWLNMNLLIQMATSIEVMEKVRVNYDQMKGLTAFRRWHQVLYLPASL